MDFITSLPKPTKGCDSIWMVMDTITKLAHLIPIRINYSLQKLVELYIENIFSMHGIPSSIVSDIDLRLTSRFGRVCKKPWVLS